MDKKVSRDTLINGKEIGYERDQTTKNLFKVPTYPFGNKRYLLLNDPEPNQGYYSAAAVRIGDMIEFGKAPVHELQWKILTPAEYGLNVNERTIIDGTEWGSLTVSQLLEKQKSKEPLFINGKGYFVPIESDQVGKDGKASVRCVELEDTFYGDAGNEIRIYEVSWKQVRDQDIKSYMDLPEFVPEFKGETRKYVNSDEMHEEYCCDWDHPSNVRKNVGTVLAQNPNLYAKEKDGR